MLLLGWALFSEVLAQSWTVPVQVTFVDVARHSASQTLTVSRDFRLDASSPQVSADLQLRSSGTKLLSIVVETPGEPRGPSGFLECGLNEPVGPACAGRLDDPLGLLIRSNPGAGAKAQNALPAGRPSEDLIVTFSYH